MCLRKENNSLHIVIRERLADGSFPVFPEDPGLPDAILNGPNAIVMLRKLTPSFAEASFNFIKEGCGSLSNYPQGNGCW
jgi:hypothetical protein